MWRVELSRICVYCGSSAGAGPDFADAARALGDLLARSGLTLVYGGAAVGLMGAVADAALAAGPASASGSAWTGSDPTSPSPAQQHPVSICAGPGRGLNIRGRRGRSWWRPGPASRPRTGPVPDEEDQ